eukprot:m.98429 g.98429  ORF g.98429 m.98429 type:complete len:459 (-) comp14871_c0_seq1:109-1485(-)
MFIFLVCFSACTCVLACVPVSSRYSPLTMSGSEEENKIPVTVLTGFLGSGKTTFVNHLLRAKHGKRVAIIENEFGEVGIDDGLVVQTDEEVIEMMNGCICCTVRDDLIQALKRLVKERRHQFDAIVIETTGLADPGPVAQTFFVDEEIASLFRLDAIVTFIDCKHANQHLDEVKPEGVENEAVEQVAFADVLVLNKSDLVTPEEMSSLRERLRAMNSTAIVLESQYSNLPLDKVIDIHAFDLDRTLLMDDQFLNVDEEHQHDMTVSSVGVNIEGEFIPDKFHQWLTALLREKGQDIFRSKGILAMFGTDERFVFQGVHMMVHMGSSQQLGMNLKPWGEEEKKMNKLCFIGRNLNRKVIAEGLQDCIFNGRLPDPGELPNVQLRFPVGTKVKVNVGQWVPGVVVAHWYREVLWETGRYAPYQVALVPEGSAALDESDDRYDNVPLVWAPRDTDAFIRAL